MTWDNERDEDILEIVKQKMEFYYNSNQYENTIEAAEQILRMEADNSNAISYMTWSYIFLERIEEAFAAANMLLELQPNTMEPHYLLNIIYVSAGQFEEAISHGEKALEFEPDNQDVYLLLGSTYVDKGLCTYGKQAWTKRFMKYNFIPEYKECLERAIDLFKRGIHISPDNSALHIQLGFSYFQLGLIDKAEESYKSAMILDAQNITLLVNYSKLHFMLGKKDEAIELKNLALMYSPENVGVQDLDNFFEASDYESTVLQFHKAMVGLYPDSSFHYFWLIKVMLQFDKNPIKILKQYLSLNPKDEEMNLTYGQLLYDKKQYKKAIDHFKDCQKLFPDNLHINGWINKLSTKMKT